MAHGLKSLLSMVAVTAVSAAVHAYVHKKVSDHLAAKTPKRSHHKRVDCKAN